ncbi:long-chain fatty acid--CoA ligase [bacterium]|nr:long-chain fatty acid--CoA ligase [bacterium]
MGKPWFNSYAEGVSHYLDYEEITMSDCLTRVAKNHPNTIGLIYFKTKIKFREFDQMVNRMANALIDLGVKPGDKVSLLLPNVPQVAIAAYAVWRIGAIVVMNNPLYTDVELEHQFNDSESTFLITLDLLGPRMLALKPKTAIKTIIVAHIRDYLSFPLKQLFPLVAKDKHRDIPKQQGVYEWLDLMKKYPADNPNISVDFRAIAALQYTGGTTGVSKGVVLTHSNLSKNCQQGLAWIYNMKPGESIVLGSLPIFHAFGLFTLNMCVRGVWSIVLIPRPEAEFIMEAIHKNKVNLFPGVPTMFIGILNHPKLKDYNLSSLKICVSGAAPCPVDVIKRFEAMSGAQIVEGFGISEASPATSINPVGGINKPGSIGLPLSDTEVKIVDLDDRNKELPANEAGELCIKGPQVSDLGYYKMPEETKETFVDGWLYTGDIAKIDDDGYTFIVDRKKDMIIAGGYNIYPRDIDEVLFTHPKIAEACTKGVADEYRGETVKAFIVLKEGEVLTKQEVIDFCKEKLAAYKVPKIVEFMDELPKSAVGKILRKDL